MMKKQLAYVVAFLACCAGGSLVGAATISSTFDANADGWTVNNDGIGPIWKYNNDHGNIEGQDKPVGDSWFFVAPSKFLGDRSAYYNGTLSFSLRQSNDSPGPGPNNDICLFGKVNGVDMRLAADIADPGNTWGSFTLPLIGGEGTVWHVGGIAGVMATEVEVRSVMATLYSLEIKGECDYGVDWARLDDVILRTPDPTTRVWTGSASGDDNWMTPANWDGARPVGNEYLQFGAVSGGHASNYNNIDASPRFLGITFTDGAPAYDVKGKPIQLAGPIVNQSTSDQTLSLDVQMVYGGGTFDTGTKNITMAGKLGGMEPFRKLGAGTLTIAATPSYTGDAVIEAGLLEISADTTLRNISGAGNLCVDNGARLTATSINVNSLTIGGPVVAAVPEPSSFVLLAAAVVGFFAWARRLYGLR